MNKHLLKQRIQNEFLLQTRKSPALDLLQNLGMWHAIITQLLSEDISDETLTEVFFDGIFDDMPAEPHKLVCLIGIRRHDNVGGNKFFGSNECVNVTRLQNGSMAYKVIGYAETTEEAQMILYGRTYPNTAWRRPQ